MGKIIEQSKFICQYRSYCLLYLESNCYGRKSDYTRKCSRYGQNLTVQKYIIGKINEVDGK